MEKKLSKHHLRTYGRGFGYDRNADPCRCAEPVRNKWELDQCSRNRGFGPDAAFCKQHAKRFECA
jgi:hypothetical protein